MSILAPVICNQDELQCPPAIRGRLGRFDLDPCASMRAVEHLATTNLTQRDNGLSAEWHGRVWAFPPLRGWEPWAERMAEHGNGIALLPAETDRPELWVGVKLTLLLARTRYILGDGRPMQSTLVQPMALLAYSVADAELLATSGIPGQLCAPYLGEGA